LTCLAAFEANGMSDGFDFRDLIRRVRAGDPDAAVTLLRQYEPEVKRLVRVRMTDTRVRRAVDSMDVCQSVLANFFVRAAAGQFDIDEPAQLLKLLLRMAHNKVLDHVRRQQAERRDVRRREAGSSVLKAVPDDSLSPSQEVAGRELLAEIRRRLSPQERYLAEQREHGRSWADLAVELGKSAEAVRKQLARALDRIAHDLGLDGPVKA
jgi:RNA polymerase sigma-70 factor (ECF subfamily)